MPIVATSKWHCICKFYLLFRKFEYEYKYECIVVLLECIVSRRAKKKPKNIHKTFPFDFKKPRKIQKLSEAARTPLHQSHSKLLYHGNGYGRLFISFFRRRCLVISNILVALRVSHYSVIIIDKTKNIDPHDPQIEVRTKSLGNNNCPCTEICCDFYIEGKHPSFKKKIRFELFLENK